MKKYFLFLFYISTLYAETYQEYLKSQREGFTSFKEARDKEFSNYLKQEWKAYQETKGTFAYKEKKPLIIPTAPIKKEQRIVPPPAQVVKVDRPKELLPPPAQVVEIDKPKTKVSSSHKQQPKMYNKIVIPTADTNLKTLYTDFFGVDIQVHYNKSILDLVRNKISKEEISESWEKLANSDYEVTLEEINAISNKLKLNGWAQFLFIKKLSRAIYKNDNEAKLFTWFSLLKMGYDAHIAYQKNKIILLLPIEGELFNTVYYRLNKKKYYAIDYYGEGKIGSIMTYENEYEGASSGIDFSLDELPLFAEEKKNKRLSFKLNNKESVINLSYNKNIMEFFQSYPQVSYSNYFMSPESLLLKESIQSSFKPLLKGKTQRESVDIILNFVQHAFKYQVDTEQFNKEKVMFPSETVYYPYSDCEDRAILFSYMIKTLLGIETVGLKYSNHMATAVRIKEKVSGEYIAYNNKKYIVADPTYVNASIGMSMPRYIGSKSYKIVATGGEK